MFESEVRLSVLDLEGFWGGELEQRRFQKYKVAKGCDNGVRDSHFDGCV